jgi:16S rRNA (guanine966-N2)-methyltransferase
MRVITGEAKGRKLKGPPSVATRPMQDKIKEALFSALESLEPDISRVLDLYAGTGGIGIEALSRGAEWADFVEQQRAACDVIAWNLAHTGLAGRSAVHQLPVPTYLRRRSEPYDLVILDPPYADSEIGATLESLSESQSVESGSIVVLGHWPKFDSASVTGNLTLLKRRCHGDSCFSIFEVQRRVATKE